LLPYTGKVLDKLAIAIEVLATLMTCCGLGYSLLVLWSARSYKRRRRGTANAVPFTILKPLKGMDARMYPGLRSHCVQEYGAEYEILFGVSDATDPAVQLVERLRAEFPERDIRLVVCPKRLGTNGKVSNLVQMLPHARHEHCIINDSDIKVPVNYLQKIAAEFEPGVGMVTAGYIGHCGDEKREQTLWAKLEALGISVELFGGVVTARLLEGGVRFALGATLAFPREALAKAGGMEPLLEYLADDYEMGARIHGAGYRVSLADVVVETTVPAYGVRGFVEHQLRWFRTVRDARGGGYAGMVATYLLPWAMVACVASGLALWSISLLSVALAARMAVVLTVGVGLLGDEQVLRDLWLVPLRDVISVALWMQSYASHEIVWRGERFRLAKGRLEHA